MVGGKRLPASSSMSASPPESLGGQRLGTNIPKRVPGSRHAPILIAEFSADRQ